MSPIAPLVIHKSEWDRLKNQANPNTEIKKVPWAVDIEAMNVQSQKWINSWPDYVQGHINKATKIKKKLHLAEIAEFEASYKKEKHKHTAENLIRAGDMIFERTSYGKELLSALFESKCLDEREIQIKFKKEIQKKEKMIEEAKVKVDNIMYAEFEKGESNRLIQKQKEKSDAECNKIMAEMKREETIRAAEIDKNNRLEDAEKIEKFRQLQVLEEKHDHCLKEAVKIYEEQNKAIQEMREKRENLDQMLADVWRRHQDRIWRMEKLIIDQIHKEKQDTGHFKENYELVQRLQEEEEKKYNDFIDKGIKKMEKRSQEKEEGETLKIYQQQISKDSQAKRIQPKSLGDSDNCERRLSVDRQSFPMARCSKLESNVLKESPPHPPRPQVLAPCAPLQDALKQRQAQAGGWGGAGAAHARFARHAAAALDQATHKHLVRKVIRSYRKQNNLKDLQIPNY